MALDLCVRGQRPQSDCVRSDVDTLQFRQAPDADELFVLKLSRFEHDHEIRPARERFPRAADERESMFQTSGGDQLIGRDVSSHDSQALTTASKIFV